MVQSIAQIPDPIQRSVYIKECARHHGHRRAASSSRRWPASASSTTGSGREADGFRPPPVRCGRGARSSAAVPEPQVEFREAASQAGSAIAGARDGAGEIPAEVRPPQSFDFKEGRDDRARCNVADVILVDARQRTELRFQTEVRRDRCWMTYREQRRRTGRPERRCRRTLFINHPDPAVCNAAVDILTSDDNYVPSELVASARRFMSTPIAEMLARGCAEGRDRSTSRR